MKHVDTIVLVEDIARSKKFYTDIMGLEILHDWGNMIVFKERFAIHESTKLSPEDEAQKLFCGGKQGRGNLIIYFETQDIEETYGRMADASITILHGIKELPWQKIFRIADPDGHVIEIGNPF